MKVFTLGYEKRNVSEYISTLNAANVKILIDVREIPWSYKRDFCKVRFSEALRNAGIEYIHLKALGNPKSIRKAGKDTAEILKTYSAYLKKTDAGIDALLEIFNYAKKKKLNVCLTCFERDSSCCHRSIITDHVHPKINGLIVSHL